MTSVKITHFASDGSMDVHDGYVTHCAACSYGYDDQEAVG